MARNDAKQTRNYRRPKLISEVRVCACVEMGRGLNEPKT